MVGGDVFAPGDPGFDEARRAWDLAADQGPAVVVFAESVVDVVRAVRFARAHGLRIAPQSTGHGALPLESLADAMLLRTSRMRRVEIFPAIRTARAEAGAQWEDVTVPAGAYGLAALAGSSPNTGVTGYTLGGGMGWLARRYGLAANSVTAVELVTPDGRLVRADADHKADIFWAVRGGGGSVGVVTALEMTLYPVAQVYAGALSFPARRASEVLHAWRAWARTVPEALTSFGRLLRVPKRGVAVIAAAYAGDATTAARLIHPLRALEPDHDTFATIPAPALASLSTGPEAPAAGVADGLFLTDLPPEAIDRIVELAGGGTGTSLGLVEIRHLGGALAREAPGAGAQPKIDAAYALLAAGSAATPEKRAGVRPQTRALKEALAPWHAGYDYYNFVEIPAQAEVVLRAASYQRLREIKAAYDPDQAIISAHPVRPREAVTWRR
jgi:hypothetical protein